MTEPIAIVGTACRFPGSASSPSKLWDLLKAPRDVVKDFPPERLNFSNFYSQNGEAHGLTDVHQRSYLLEEDVRLFDAAFFRINPKEASGMDPQHRILLETVYEALEAAGWSLDAVQGSQTSVHVGVMTDDYYTIQTRDPETLGSHAATSLSRCILSNRISYVFDLKGPSMTIDTACSSSLVSLHLAVQGLRSGEASQAIVAGTNLLLDPYWFLAESSLHMLSPESRSRMWNQNANGYARGDGCAAVVLKPLSKAIQDGDHIECIIRETGVNSDGRTNGVTMPSPVAQAALIRQTYKNAGLDPVVNRCQYFECHGTGTQAGDPVEARAIRDAFFPIDCPDVPESSEPLYCGSIKTIVGHLEGCAGLAGLLRASLAIQHGAIPPNMHFNELSPSVKPFYGNLCVPTSLLPWPETHGKPRRASINSFGFGGTNAHTIIESYEPPPQPHPPPVDDMTGRPELLGPLVFSARSRPSLIRSLGQMLEHIRLNPLLDLDALSWVLHSRRSAFSHRIAIPAVSDRQRLMGNLEQQLAVAANSSSDGPFGVRALNDADPGQSPRILGIFTGQGAQAAQMGRQLLSHCRLFQESIMKCQEALAALPEAPAWSLLEELSADEANTRVSEALISQPLCTAVQIALVDLLRASGVKFAAVVGHSSGEIGAAYAVGILSLRDAMGVAYYRGYVAHLAQGPGGKPGSMMAAAMSFHEATSLCSQPRFAGRVGVAASNAPSSVTLSGDMDVIQEIKAFLDEKKIQARQLRVDTAYHSHHMLRCAETYLAHLKKLNVRIQKPAEHGSRCVWSSSVRVNTDMLREPVDELRDQYWVHNMVNPVLFSEALGFAVKSDPAQFAVALEVGPHPALKGPVNQTLKPLIASPLPHTGCLERGKDSTETMSMALGFLWSYLGPSSVDFCGWREAFGLIGQPQMLKGLPSYAWDHDQIHWRESRLSHNYRLGSRPPHNLLGRLHEDSQHEKTWRNIIHLNEMPWLKGHMFQGQVLFPGAGYVSLVVEAAKAFVQHRSIKLVEVQDMNISKALVVSEDSGAEILFTIRTKSRAAIVQDDSIIEAEFICCTCTDERVLDKSCDGRLLIHLGQAEPGDMPSNPISQSELPPLSTEKFHGAVSDLGLVYEGVFRSLRSINRLWGHAKASASWAEGELDVNYTLHPAVLDIAFQAGLATFVSVAENTMVGPYLPVGIRRVIVNPNQIYMSALGEATVDIEARMARSTKSVVEVDIDVCAGPDSESNACGIQIDGLIVKAIAEPQPSDDRNVFVKTIWGVDVAYGLTSPSPVQVDMKQSVDMIEAYERIALFFMQNLIRQIRPDEIPTAKWHHQELIRYINAILTMVQEGNHPILNKEWLNDSHDAMLELADRYPSNVEIVMLMVVGENLPSVVQGESEVLEHMMQDDLLSRLYKESSGLMACTKYVVDLMRQITHKYPRTKILGIGADTTLSVLDAIGNAYSSFTCTDVSESLLNELAERLPDEHVSKADFKVFNVESPPAGQGFSEGSYDVVIATNTLHTTQKVSEAVQNVRSLLRPGGFLITIEATGSMIHTTGLMGGLESWWLGIDEGRTMGPGMEPKNWDDILQRHGFSGIDFIIHDHPNVSHHSYSVFATQAIDDRFDLLRDPLMSIDGIPESPVLIIGGKTLTVSKLVRRAEKLLRRWASNITSCDSIDELDPAAMLPGTFVLCLADLDKAFFKESLTTQRLENLQEMLGTARNILWVTAKCLVDDPYSNMMVGIGRALAVELPHVNMQFLDFDSTTPWDLDVIIQHLFRIALASSFQNEDHKMLWVQEPEVVVRGDQVLVPRIVQDSMANESLNAKRRRINKLAEPTDRIEVVYDDASPSLVQCRSIDVPDTHVAVDVNMSVALHSGQEKPCVLCLGHLQNSGAASSEAVLVLSETDSSTVVVNTDSLFKPIDPQLFDADTLVGVASALIASFVLSSIPSYGTALMCGASDAMAEAISTAAAQTGRKVLFVAVTTATRDQRPGWITVHPRAAERAVRRLIPCDTTALLRFSDADVDNILPSLPKHCAVRSFDTSCIPRQSVEVEAVIAKAYQAYKTASTAQREVPQATIVNIKDAPQQLLPHRERLSVVVDWKRNGPVNSIIQPLEATNLLSPNKTYFLVGMAGELGQSLCRFMIQGGARHIVLASRNPTNDPHWVKDLRSMGANIQIVKMDVTDRAQVRETVLMLRQNMPEIGGVANAALVFEPGLFVNFSAENIEKQLKPKVDGTVNLDQEFSKDNLDFFLTFGSLATVCGNPGQAMYHAGNMFMTSLVEKRRRRGQAASVLHFGLLVDVGYVARMDRSEGTDIEERLRSLLVTPLAESEFHHVVLQGIVSGRPNSASGEVIMGMQPYVDDGKVDKPLWVDKAFFSHMVHEPTAADGPTPVNASSSSMQHLRESLDKASNINEATEAVKELFYKKIELMIKVPRASIDTNAPLADLGLDSLNGIDIRKWLLEEMQIDMPLLRILGRESMLSICASVAEKFVDKKGEQTDEAPAERTTILEIRTDNPATTQHLALPETPTKDSQYNDSEASLDSPITPTSSNDEVMLTKSKVLCAQPETGAVKLSSASPESLHELEIKLPDLENPKVALDYKRTERLSFAQAGIHFLHTFLEDRTSFNVTAQYSIKGPLNVNRLTRAMKKTLSHHGSYQTCFFADPGSPQLKQHVARNINPNRLVHVHSSISQAEDHAFETVAKREYALAYGETFRAILISHDSQSHTMVFGFHLIASDALSFSIFLRDLDRAYRMSPLPLPSSSYLDFTRQQIEDLDNGRFDEPTDFWKRQLDPIASLFPLLPFSQVRTRQARRVFGNHIVSRELTGDMAKSVREASQTCGATSMQFYLAAMQVLLSRLADVEDICIGVTDSGRGRAGDFADTIGHFANILPMRFKINTEQSFAELASQTSHTVLSAFDNAQVPFDVLLERLGIERSPVHTPLFQVAFNYRVGDILQRSLGDCIMVMKKYADVKTPHDLTINVTQTATQGHLVECITADNLYSISATEFIMETYIGLVESLCRDQSAKVKHCKLYSDTQVRRAITLGRGPTVEYLWPKTLTDRFQQVCSAYLDSMAIKDAKGSLSYKQLAQRVSVYAASLVDAKASLGSRIAVLCEPSIDTYATMLAILHIGAVYVPLDISLPATRRRTMIDTCKPDILVFHTATANVAAEDHGDGETPTLNLSNLDISAEGNSTLLAPSTTAGDSFLLFTSGSTGTPKGIRLGQSGIMNYAAAKRAKLDLGQVKVLQQTSVAFDMAIAQAFNAFANGGTLVVAPAKARGDPSMIARLILDEAIEFTLCTPSEYLMLATYAADCLQQCTSWKHACSGGEVATERLITALKRLELPSLTLTDCYGPTEVSCATTFQSIPVYAGVEAVDETHDSQGDTTSSVGEAIPNTFIYILSEDGSTALPPGMPGEICVAGAGVAKGYLDPVLSSAKFVHDPFATPQDLARGWGVMYKTGDKGLLQPDGSLRFLGRTDGGDTVIKLRGLRIDLNEVAGAILKAAPEDSLADAVVTVRGNPEYLAAHVVFARGKDLEQAQLDLIRRDLPLPRYMIPSIIVALDRLPTTPNGKVDRRALQALPLPAQKDENDNKATLTVPEGELLVVWREVLGEAAGAANIGPDSDFFTVGGSSLLLVRLQNAIREKTGVVLSLQELYQATTLRKMAAAMHKERGLLAEETIDWNAETAIPTHILEAAHSDIPVPEPRKHKRQVLLTGSTTFLGGEILRCLIMDDDIVNIHCVAVPEDARHKIPSDDTGKVIVYSGSLLSPNLGLSGKEAAFLQSNIDQIMHAAVQGHCMNNYSSVKQVLYLSTQSLVRLAVPRRIPFHFVSAPRVVLLSGRHEGGPVSMAAHKPPTDGTQGVTASKWASEIFLENVSRETGLPVVIHRHCALTGERAPAEEVMNSVVHYSRISFKVPQVATAEGFFDFKDVVQVASEIACEPPAIAGLVCFRHHSSDVRVPFTEMAQRMQAIYGGEFELVDPLEWLGAAVSFGMGELLMIHLRANMESGKPLIFPYLGV